MEAERRRLRVRKPLADCSNTITSTKTTTNTNTNTNTNTTTTSSQSSSASTATPKRLNPTLSAVTKTLLAHLNPPNPKPSSQPLLPPIPSTPSRPPVPSSASGTSDCEVFEPCSVYRRRQTAIKRKSKGKENTDPSSCPPAPKTRSIGKKMKEEGHNSISKESMVTRKKKQRAIPAGKDVSKHSVAQDDIEKQRAYFKEIDAFDLPIEVVDSDQELD